MKIDPKQIALAMWILGTFWAIVCLPGLRTFLSAVILAPGYLIYGFWIYRTFREGDKRIVFYLWLFSACWHSVFIFGVFLTMFLFEGFWHTLVTLYGVVGCLLSLLGAFNEHKRRRENKSSQTIPAKRPLFHNDLNQINHQPTRKPN